MAKSPLKSTKILGNEPETFRRLQTNFLLPGIGADIAGKGFSYQIKCPDEEKKLSLEVEVENLTWTSFCCFAIKWSDSICDRMKKTEFGQKGCPKGKGFFLKMTQRFMKSRPSTKTVSTKTKFCKIWSLPVLAAASPVGRWAVIESWDARCFYQNEYFGKNILSSKCLIYR